MHRSPAEITEPGRICSGTGTPDSREAGCRADRPGYTAHPDSGNRTSGGSTRSLAGCAAWPVLARAAATASSSPRAAPPTCGRRRPGCVRAGSGTTSGTVANPAIDELSGLAQSRAHPACSGPTTTPATPPGSSPSATDGADLGTVTVSGADRRRLGGHRPRSRSRRRRSPLRRRHRRRRHAGERAADGHRVPVPRAGPARAGQATAVAAQAVIAPVPRRPARRRGPAARRPIGRPRDRHQGHERRGRRRLPRCRRRRRRPPDRRIPLERVGDLGTSGRPGLAQRLAELAGLGDVANSVTAGDASAQAGVAADPDVQRASPCTSGRSSKPWLRRCSARRARAPAPDRSALPAGRSSRARRERQALRHRVRGRRRAPRAVPRREVSDAAKPGRVRTSGPCSVTAMVCSKWAERRWSRVTTVQPSSRTSVSRTAGVHHRLDGEHHALLELQAPTRRARSSAPAAPRASRCRCRGRRTRARP